MESDRLRAAIASAQADEADGYQVLLDVYGPRLYGYFFRATGNHHDAEDLLGDLMLRLVRRLRDYDDRGRFEPWLFRIAANMVRDRIRRAKVRPPVTSLATEGEDWALGDKLPAPVEPADGALLAQEASAELQEALEKLDATTRDMVILRHFSELSFKEIAEMFDCPLGTALAKVHRGLRTMRRLMGTDDAA